MKNKTKNLFHLSWFQSLIFIIAFISSLTSSPLVLQARSSVNNTVHFSDQFNKASFPLLGQDVLRQSDDKNAAVYDNDDDDFKNLPNDNPPEPTNPSYREYQLPTLSKKDLVVHLVPGKSLTGSNINLPNLTASDLSTLTKSNINIDSSSKLQEAEVQVDYNATKQNLNISLTDTALMKTNGAGTQLRLNIQSPDNLRKDQVVIGIWRNYIMHPYCEIDLGNKLHLQYMLNNDSSTTDTATDTIPMRFVPNFRIRDESQSGIIDTMYSGYSITYSGDHNFYVGTGDSPNTKSYNEKVDPASHCYVSKDPQDSNTILFQFDSTPTLTLGNVSRQCRLRVLSKLEKSSTGQYVVLKQKFINYTVDSNNKPVNLPPVWFYRKYDTDLNGHDHVPIYYRELDADGIPRGLYFKYTGETYRLDFLFDIPGGPDGWMADLFNNDMQNFTGQRTQNHTPDEEAFSSGDSGIKMTWSKNKIGALAFGQSSPTIGFDTSSSAALAPTIRSDKEELTYCHDIDKGEDLPPVSLSGAVNSTNKNTHYVKLYYSIDQIPTANAKGKSLVQVNIPSDQHKVTSWVKYDNLQITNKEELTTLATPDSEGHSIYIYGIDNLGYQSNIVEIKVLPNVKVPIHYICGTQNIKGDNYFLKTEGDSYNLNNTDYAPTKILFKGTYYKLSPNQTNLSGTVTTDLKEININYEKAGSVAITQVPKLDFGKIMLLPKLTYYNIVTQTGDLQITNDTTDPPSWKLYMSADPFYRVTKDNQLDKNDSLKGLLYYRKPNKESVLPNNPVPINTTLQEVSSYADLAASDSETQGNTTTTNFRKVWWDSSKTPPEQVSGPLLLSPSSLKLPQANYRSTVTWSLDNVPN